MPSGPSRTVTLNVVGDAGKLTSTLDAAAAKTEASGGRFGKAFGGLGSVLNQVTGGALGPMTEHIESARMAMERMGDSGSKVSVGMMKYGAGIAALGAGLTALGDKDKAAKQQLKQSIENAGQSYDDYDKRIEQTIKANEKFGHKATESMDALRVLTQATGDTDRALKLMGLAADLAAAKHMSLSDAAGKLAKVQGGATKVLKEFGINAEKAGGNTKQFEAAQLAVSKAAAVEAKAHENLAMMQQRLAGKTSLTISETQGLQKAHEAVTLAAQKHSEAAAKVGSMHEVVISSSKAAADNMDMLGKKIHGQADAAANTFTGHMKALKTEIEDGAAKLGQKYGPALTGIGAGLTTVGSLTKMLKGGQQAAAATTAVLTTATEGEAVAMDAAAVSEGLALAPILLIIAAIAILAIGIYELATHWKAVWNAIKDVVKGAINFITDLISGIVDWIGKHWQLLIAILTGPFGLLVYFVKGHFKEIIDFLKGIPGDILRIAESIGRSLANPVINAINMIIGAWDSLNFSIPSVSIPGLGEIGGGTIGLPQIPKIPLLAAGGIATARTLAMLGDGGESEAVVPLSRAGDFGFGGGGGDVTLTIPFTIDGRQFARATARYTREEWNKLARGSSTLPTQ